MHTRKFNRHANMNKLTMTTVMYLINYSIIEGDKTLTNMLYGLFDGYDYTDAIMEIANKMDKRSVEYGFIDALCSEVKSYPDGETELF